MYGRFHSDSPSDELPPERKCVSGVLLPAVAQAGQRRVPRVLQLGEAELVEDVVNSGSGSHLKQKWQNFVNVERGGGELSETFRLTGVWNTQALWLNRASRFQTQIFWVLLPWDFTLNSLLLTDKHVVPQLSCIPGQPPLPPPPHQHYGLSKQSKTDEKLHGQAETSGRTAKQYKSENKQSETRRSCRKVE